MVGPFKRCSRPSADGNYFFDYLDFKEYANNGSQYLAASILIERDFLELCDYIHPSNSNFSTYSHRVHELLLRCGVEVEGNCRAILLENKYTKVDSRNWTARDFKRIEKSHALSEYSVVFSNWHEKDQVFYPFKEWKNQNTPRWYGAYNSLKHRKYEDFSHGNFEMLSNAVAALGVLISAQFQNFPFKPVKYALGIGELRGDNRKETISGLLRIGYPAASCFDETYDFEKDNIMDDGSFFRKYDYDSCL